MGSSVEASVLEIVADQIKGLSVENINLSDTLMSLGADSLDAVEIVLSLESTYKLSISEADFEKLLTVADIIKFIESKTV